MEPMVPVFIVSNSFCSAIAVAKVNQLEIPGTKLCSLRRTSIIISLSAPVFHQQVRSHRFSASDSKNNLKTSYRTKDDLRYVAEKLNVNISTKIIQTKFSNEKKLPELERDLYMIPYKMTVGQLQNVLKRQMRMNRRHGMIILVNGSVIPALQTSMAELAYKYLDEDGLLYITYANDDAYG
ncbi:unnamed protein product [Enterobius vermicularis]|uniref:Autophagy-related protein n=1 Tax=Enterobius vermicularis TaxID=51028 RepID=A0A0N4VQE7_ENTVE|nr:unnamed protein product [Enterobius vermicularis]